MKNTLEFYSSGLGDNLIKKSFYPKEIVSFLDKEKEIVKDELRNFDLLFEVGCMEGRYLDVALSENKKYYGIDVVERYVEMGQEILSKKELPANDFTIKIADAASLDEIFIKNNLSKALIVFPFNSFGNMVNMKDVIKSLATAKRSFLIFTYATDEFSNNARLDYYKNCGYKDIECEEDAKGIRFFSDQGLNTIAYKENYIKTEFNNLGVSIVRVNFANIGLVYKGFLN